MSITHSTSGGGPQLTPKDYLSSTSDKFTTRTIMPYTGMIAPGVSESYLTEGYGHGTGGIRIKMSKEQFKKMEAKVKGMLESAMQITEAAKISVSYDTKQGVAEVVLTAFPSKLEQKAELELLKICAYIAGQLI